MITERRRFIATASGVIAAVAASAIVDEPNAIAQPKVALVVDYDGVVAAHTPMKVKYRA